MRRLSIFLLLPLALVAIACGDDDDSVAASDGADATDASDAASSDESMSDEGTDADTVESPLAEVLGVSTDPTEQDERFAEQERLRQEYVAQCMAAEGFEYTPVDSSSISMAIGPGGEFDEDEYVERYGFGISTMFLEMAGEPISDIEDPNQDYVESLSEEEQQAYNQALYGDMSDGAASSGSVQITPGQLAEQGGCFNEALAEIQDPFQAVYEEFGDELTDLFERIESDPRVAAANEVWAACMSEAGYTYATPDEIFEDLNERMAPLYEAVFPDGGGPALSGGAGSVGGVSVVQVEGESFEGPPELTAEQQATLEDIQAFELEVAAANHECEADLDAVRAEVTADLERAFVEDNRAELEQLAAG